MRSMRQGDAAGPSASPSSLRPTRQRKAVVEALREGGSFLTAQEIYGLLRGRGGGIGLSTVYRTLQALADAGEIDAVRNKEGETLYRRCSRDGHHHHLVCRNCGASVEIESPELERWAENVASKHGFAEVTHTLEVYGLCRSCPS